MTTGVVISCGKDKRSSMCEAQHMYTGKLFQMAKRFAVSTGNPWFILSARYGLISPQAVIAPYDQTIGARADDAWVKKVFGQIDKHRKTVDSLLFVTPRRYFAPFENWPGIEWAFGDLPRPSLGFQAQWMKRHHGMHPIVLDSLP